MGNPRAASRMLEKLGEELLRDDNVLLAYGFGSCVNGFVTPLSDVDVAVLLKDDSLKETTRLLGELAKALNVNEDRIDLVDLAKAPTPIKYNIVKYGLKLVDRGGYEEGLKGDLITRYLEVRRILDLSYNDVQRTLNCKVDKGLLRSRLTEALEHTATLKEEILSKPKEQVVTSRLYRSSMERCMHIAIEAILDVCRHIVSAKKLGMPETYKDLVKLLRDSHTLSNDLAERIEKLVGLRNILIHRYMLIDRGKLYDEAESLIKTTQDFMNAIESLIEKE